MKVELLALPSNPSYTELVLSAAASGDLPDLLDFDGPHLYSCAWSGKLKPIDSCVPRKVLDDLLPSIRRQGTYAGQLWGIGTFGGEWNTYAFAPTIWSEGGDLIDPEFRTTDGFLNGPRSVKALTLIQNWVKEGLVDPGKDEKAFVEGRSPISWMGHWRYGEYSKTHPNDVAIVPLPDFGEGTVTGMGSWQWGITSGATDGDAVWRFLAYLLRPEQVLRMSEANGAVPATNSAVKLSPTYREGGAERLFIEPLRDGVAWPRPQTPVYPAITGAFSRAFAEIVLDGAPVRQTLDQAVRTIDKDLAAHDGYPESGS